MINIEDYFDKPIKHITSVPMKIIKSGDIYEFYSYENPIQYGWNDERHIGRGGQAKTSQEDKKNNRNKTMIRARQNIRRTVNCNVSNTSKFITLTYKDNVTDLKTSNLNFKKFIMKLNYKIGFKVKYTSVLEFQKRGAIHYHLIMYNCPYIANKDLQTIWGYGFVKINKIDNVDNVGAYITKYMQKDLNDDRLLGNRCYFNSQGLKKPEIIYNENEVLQLSEHIAPYKCYETKFDNEYNSILYIQYNTKRLPK